MTIWVIMMPAARGSKQGTGQAAHFFIIQLWEPCVDIGTWGTSCRRCCCGCCCCCCCCGGSHCGCCSHGRLASSTSTRCKCRSGGAVCHGRWQRRKRRQCRWRRRRGRRHCITSTDTCGDIVEQCLGGLHLIKCGRRLPPTALRSCHQATVNKGPTDGWWRWRSLCGTLLECH